MKRGCGPDGLKEQGSKAVCVPGERCAHRQVTPTPRGHHPGAGSGAGAVLWLPLCETARNPNGKRRWGMVLGAGCTIFVVPSSVATMAGLSWRAWWRGVCLCWGGVLIFRKTEAAELGC